MALPEHLKTGMRGEQLAARYLRKNGYTILSANYRTPLGEIDIIALSPEEVLCFIEVKTRSPGQMMSPSEAVDYAKERNIKTCASAFTKRHIKESFAERFDIIEVILHDLFTADINHIKNAF